MLGRLLLRTLPGEYTNDSSYAWFPLMTPDAIQGILTKPGDINLYSLKRPSQLKAVPDVGEYAEAKRVLEDEAFGARRRSFKPKGEHTPCLVKKVWR